ncbi:MAG: metallophosphoesterase family protein [Bacillota bacterium]|nr:metallophosphoesterase family protein [Bacillota bacterium]
MVYRKLGYRLSLGIILLLIVVYSPALAATGSGPDTGLPDQILLSWTEDPATTQTISWRSGAGNTREVVQYLPAADYDGSFTAAREVAGKGSPLYDGYFRWEATLRGLTPGTQYVYRVGREGAWSEPAFFSTGSACDNFSFLFMGDVQGGYQEWGEMLAGVLAENPDLSFLLLGGDLVDQGHKIEEWEEFFAAAPEVFRRLPLLPALGNHDNPELFRKIFALPQNGPAGYGETIYSFDYGSCHITVLDSNSLGKPGTGDYEKIAAWLRQDLARSQKAWKFVVCHHPPYQAVDNWRGEHLQANWVPLLEEGGVDLVFAGDQHVYMRTKPLWEGKVRADGQGIVYIIGNAGDKHYGLGPEKDYIARAVAGVSSYQLVEIQGNTLTLTSRDAEGRVLDRCILVKEAQDQDSANGPASRAAVGFFFRRALLAPLSMFLQGWN